VQTVQEFATTQNISKAIVDTWIYRHGLPVIQIGRRVYIEVSDYESWIAEHKKTINQGMSIKIREATPAKQCRQSSITAKLRRVY